MDLETIDEISKDLIQTELVPSSHVLPVFGEGFLILTTQHSCSDGLG